MDSRRQRHPDDVPTPVAVAVADFCRRAKAPASPSLVRSALALLSEADDARARALADTEPEARPLGPFAVVDVLRGTPQAAAAERERQGFYDEVRRQAAKSPVPAAPTLTAPARRGPELLVDPAAMAERPKKARTPTLKEKVAPRRRKAGEGAEAPARPAPPLPGTAFLPKRTLPAPRGRFTRIEPSRASFEILLRADGRETLVALLEQVPHRVALLRALEQGYVGRRGEALGLEEVEGALRQHRLLAGLEQREREAVLAGLVEQKGALGRTAHALGLEGPELQALVKALGLEREVKEVRERFAREALSPRTLGLRVELLQRTRYLEDLGIEQQFREALTRDLAALVDEVAEAATDAPTLVDMLSRQHGLHAEGLRRALEKTGLLAPWLADEG